MNPSEGLKQFLYDRFLHFLHLAEDISRTEIEEFANLAKLQGLTSFPNLTGIHVIDCIGNNEPINNTSIAEKMNLSKASITKVSTQLHTEGFIKRSQMNDNKKEVYFSLSPKGRQVFEAHTLMHEKIKRKFFDDLNSFSESELQASLKFFQTIINQNANVVKTDGKT